MTASNRCHEIGSRRKRGKLEPQVDREGATRSTNTLSLSYDTSKVSKPNEHRRSCIPGGIASRARKPIFEAVYCCLRSRVSWATGSKGSTLEGMMRKRLMMLTTY